jgi:nickel/cobalt transporter (NiCoT) family protein
MHDRGDACSDFAWDHPLRWVDTALDAMTPLTAPHDLAGLVAVAALLGLRHGFDADHLAAIDGMTRFNAADRPRLARRTGLWFSLGHGAVVLAFALAVAGTASAWDAPAWLEPFGAWTSIAVLLLLGVANLAVLRRAPADAAVTGVAWRSALFARLLRASGRGPVMGVGALFAVSFDTLSQAALMAVSGTALQSLWVVAALAGAFVLGMIVTDGLNGLWVARLLRRTDRGAARASRVMGGCVAGVSIATALLGIGTRLSPGFDAWAEAHGTHFSVAIVGLMLAGFALAAVLSPGRSREALPAGR